MAQIPNIFSEEDKSGASAADKKKKDQNDPDDKGERRKFGTERDHSK